MISKQAVLEIIESIEMELSDRCYDGIVKQINALPSISDGWIEIDIESESYPPDFQECWLLNLSNQVDMGFLKKYGDDISNAEWQTENGDYEFDGISHYIIINRPLPPAPTK